MIGPATSTSIGRVKVWAACRLALGLLAPNCTIIRGLAVGVGEGVGDVRASGRRKPTKGVLPDAGGVGRAANVPAADQLSYSLSFEVVLAKAQVAVEFRLRTARSIKERSRRTFHTCPLPRQRVPSRHQRGERTAGRVGIFWCGFHNWNKR